MVQYNYANTRDFGTYQLVEQQRLTSLLSHRKYTIRVGVS